ncbi:MAG: hypothetical protein LBJ69_03520 [Holosporales bacterium]|jgi:hypothetical protein|nr:hypothetical protein [Holosporales bacterium]
MSGRLKMAVALLVVAGIGVGEVAGMRRVGFPGSRRKGNSITRKVSVGGAPNQIPLDLLEGGSRGGQTDGDQVKIPGVIQDGDDDLTDWPTSDDPKDGNYVEGATQPQEPAADPTDGSSSVSSDDPDDGDWKPGHQ